MFSKILEKKLLNKSDFYIYTIDEIITNDGNPLIFSDDIEQISIGHSISREFSWSSDKNSWSQWKNISQLEELGELKDFYFRIKWCLEKNFLNTPIIIKSFNLNLDCSYKKYFCQDEDFIKELEKYKPDIDVSNSLDNISKINNEINFWLNYMAAGLDSLYFLSSPDLEQRDIFLNEYPINNIICEKPIKIIIPGGIIPEETINYTEIGIEWEDFEIEINVDYFKYIFGKDKRPRTNDYIYINLINKMYRINSWKYKTTINQRKEIFVIGLKTADKISSMNYKEKSNEIFDKQLSQEELFGEHFEKEFVDLSNKIVDYQKFLSDDILRKNINKEMIFNNVKLNNYSTKLFDNCYDLQNINVNESAIDYNIKVKILNNFSYSSWVNFLEPKKIFKLNIVNSNVNGNILEIENYFDLNKFLKYGDYVRSGNDYYKVINVDGKNISINTDLNLTDIFIPEIHNLFTFSNMNLTIFDRKNVYLNYGNYKIVFNIPEIDTGKWFNVNFNLSNQYEYVGFYVWKINSLESNSTKLEKVSENEKLFNGKINLDEEPKILGSKMMISNIRYWKNLLEENEQSIVNCSYDVPNKSMAFIIDNCDLIFDNKKLSSSLIGNYRNQIKNGDL
jgi:hypothetical protein